MEQIAKLRSKVRILVILQVFTLAVVLLLALQQPDQFFETKTVYAVGQQGPQGIPGIGFPGKDGISIVGPQGPPGESVVGPQGPAGEKGESGNDGEDGQDGRTVEFRTNPNTCNIEYRYTGDRTWITLVEQECQDG